MAPAERRQPDPWHREPGRCGGDGLGTPGPGGGQAQPLHVRVHHGELQHRPRTHTYGGCPPGDRHPVRPPLRHDHRAHTHGSLPPRRGPSLPGGWPARPRAPLLCGERRRLDRGLGGLSPLHLQPQARPSPRPDPVGHEPCYAPPAPWPSSAPGWGWDLGKV
uniref:Macaca fascicularis brain cDNA clone: QtrA-17232, similar to human pyridoxal (pyridoxine, vitamin B6) phosphatase (PDXP), mRNA, RefSeq: NM_020315.3 n=1 Tax=Macaca fascicularis TaxID=9541 RepID=I7GPJ0_MACFA|nr:unnamed protein product [Macaca fascicularis]